MKSGKGVKLHLAISLLVLFAVLTTILVNWYSATNALRASLTEEYLRNNYNYAKKLTFNTQELLKIMNENLQVVARVEEEGKLTQENLELWMTANNTSFNSIFATDKDGVIKVISPTKVRFNGGEIVQSGIKVQSETMKKALTKREAFISEPYQATSGQYILLLSTPVFHENGEYKGLIAGTIYLESESTLRNILSNHEQENGSYVYVVDKDRRLIYHPDTNRVNDIVGHNTVIDKVLTGESGATPTTNSQGVEFFIGYAFEEETGWGIISQTPTTVLEEPLQILFNKMAMQSIPLLIIIFIIAGILARTISKPLSDLTVFSMNALDQENRAPIENLMTRSKIYEVHQLYYHFRNYILLLNNQIYLDGLTGLSNRRTFDATIMDCVKKRTPFSLIMLDIDRFKKVNDRYGHLVGDDVLKFLSRTIERFCHEDDFAFRYGGEEFVILLRGKKEDTAYRIAEKLRKTLETQDSPTGHPITISIGISSYKRKDSHPKSVILRADTALYQSKKMGRNQTSIYHDDDPSLPA